MAANSDSCFVLWLVWPSPNIFDLCETEMFCFGYSRMTRGATKFLFQVLEILQRMIIISIAELEIAMNSEMET